MGLLAVILVAALLLVNAVYVAAEFAAVSVRRSRLRQLAGDGNVLARWLLPYVDNPAALDRYIAACQIGITLSSLVLGRLRAGDVRRLAGAVDGGSRRAGDARGPIHGRRGRAAGAHGRPGDSRRAGPEVAGAAVSHAVGALHVSGDAGLAVDLPPVHRLAERQRAVPAAR